MAVEVSVGGVCLCDGFSSVEVVVVRGWARGVARRAAWLRWRGHQKLTGVHWNLGVPSVPPEPNACEPSKPCNNGGSCSVSTLAAGGFTCVCAVGFSGLVCELDGGVLPPPDCEADLCKNGGKCYVAESEAGGVAMCACPLGFSGQFCELDGGVLPPPGCEADLCKNGGKCYVAESEAGGVVMCACPLGFSGQFCERDGGVLPPPGCEADLCKNGGRCYVAESEAGGVAMCACPLGFSGQFCELDMCSFSPCYNGGSCVTISSGFQCLCGGTGFEGDLCDKSRFHSFPVHPVFFFLFYVLFSYELVMFLYIFRYFVFRFK